ncbi:MAG: TIGR02117 family protein [Alphaproteobacteria bacterium]|nr:TIGR02117 family protein [Alphaproteobacteria bacterium]
MRRAARIGLRLLLALLAVPILYLTAALLLATIPANAGWHEAREGVRVFVRTNGVHTWIMVPTVSADMDWRPLVPGRDLRDPRWGNGDYVAIGYGNREVYLNTPTWADLKPADALAAAFGTGSSLLHADHDDRPQPGPAQRPITLSRDEYRRLVAYIRASFRYDAQGRTISVAGRGYGASDAFYEAAGTYTALRTCNEWTGGALRAAGVRTGLWTPLSASVMWRLDAPPSAAVERPPITKN